MNPKHAEAERQALLNDPGIKINDDNTIDIDLSKVKSKMVTLCVKNIAGTQGCNMPDYIDREMYTNLMNLKNDPVERKKLMDEMRIRLSEESFKAFEMRFEAAIERAEELAQNGKIVEADKWDGVNEPANEGNFVLKNSSNKNFSLDFFESNDLRIVITPSIFMRDDLHRVF